MTTIRVAASKITASWPQDADRQEQSDLLARGADRMLTHRSILKAIWGANAIDHPEHLWVLMAQLRKRIEPDPSHPRYLLSEPWVGYRFVSEPAER